MVKGKRILTIIISVLVPSVSSFAQEIFWESTIGAEATVVFSFATSNDGVIFAATSGGVFHSSDLGRVWVPCGSGVSYPFSVAVDSEGRLFTGNMSGVFRSIDDGASWSQMLSTTEILPDSSLFFHRVSAIIALDHDAIEAGTNGTGIYRSTDHGQTWSKVDSGLTNDDVYSFSRSASGIVYAGTKDGVFRSLDDGTSWVHRPPVRDFAYAIASGDNQEVFAGVSYTVGESGVYRSTNSGDSWTTFGLQDYAVFGLATDRQGILLAAARGWNPNNNGVYRTTIQSGAWTHEIDGLPIKECRALAILADGNAIVGTEGAGIYRTSAPLTSVENPMDLPNYFALLQNFPNPFNPSTTISYDLPERAFVTFKVYNLLGQEVATLVNKYQEVGSYQVQFDGTGLTSGVYFYRMRAGGFVETKRLVLLK